MNKKCNRCGAEMPKGADFCARCGNPLKKDSQISRERQPRTNHNALNALLVVLGFLFIIIFVAIFYSEYSARNKNRNDKSESAFNSTETDSTAVDTIQSDLYTTTSQEDVITKRVEYIYKEVFSRGFNDGYKYDSSIWLTKEFRQLWKKNIDLTPEGDIPCFGDYDHWIQGQDWENPTMNVQSVELISEKRAIVMIKVRAFSKP